MSTAVQKYESTIKSVFNIRYPVSRISLLRLRHNSNVLFLLHKTLEVYICRKLQCYVTQI